MGRVTLDRAVGLSFLFAALTLACAACRDRDRAAAPHPTNQAAVAPAASARPLSLSPADLAAYQRGHERELELMRAALARLRRADGDSGAWRRAADATMEGQIERAGAAAAGLTPERYRELVSRLDSLLVEQGREPGWRLLDSLRVELAVLRSRFTATAAGERDGTP